MKFKSLYDYCVWLDSNYKAYYFKKQIHTDNYKIQLLEETKFLPKESKISERIYCILNNIKKILICECGKELKFKQYSSGYKMFCSNKCSSNSTYKKSKIKLTNIQKYGHENTFHSSNAREKYNTYIQNNTLVAEAYNKGLQTKLNNYGVDTLCELFGIITQKTQRTKLLKYGNKNFNNREKSKLSRDEKKINETLKKSMLIKYGVEYFARTIIGRQQISDRMINRHKSGFTQEQKQIMQDRYGVESPLQYPIFFEKCEKNFGWKDYILPNDEIIKLQGYEPLAFDELLLTYSFEQILHSKVDVPEIWYYHNNIKHRYYPDFYIPTDNLIIEVKSTYTMLKDFYINLLKAQACKKAGYKFRFYIYNSRLRLN